MDVFDFAVQMETDAETLYRTLAAGSSMPGIQKIFEDLAKDEQRHRRIFQALKEQQPFDLMPESEVLENAKNIFHKFLTEKQDLPSEMTNLDSYRYAMTLEADAVRLYGDAVKRETRPEVKEILLRIAEEEKKHFNIVENIFRFVNAPNQYLAWAEFSNLEEFRAFGREVDI